VTAGERWRQPTPTEEVAFGGFSCSAFTTPFENRLGRASFFFEGSGTVTHSSEFDHQVEFFSDAEAICSALVPLAVATVQEAGCTTSPARSFSNEFEVGQSFEMVCSGARSRVIHAIAELGRIMLDASA